MPLSPFDPGQYWKPSWLLPASPAVSYAQIHHMMDLQNAGFSECG
jgi:hypothetical protein